MKRLLRQKVVLGAVLCSMAAGLANAASVWNPAANGIEPPAEGYWHDGANWTESTVPVDTTKVVFNVDNTAECVVTNAQVSGMIVMGDNGSGSQVNVLRIVDGGIVSAQASGGDWIGIGYNKGFSHLTVETGGLLDVGTRMGVGMIFGATGLVEVYGDIELDGALQLSEAGGDSTVMIYQGGTVSAESLEMGSSGSQVLDIWGDGVLTFAGDQTNDVFGFIADGRILGNRLTNNLDVALVVDAGVTNTVVGATPSIPNIAGLSQDDAADVLAAFGYVVGAITVDFEPGALTGYVIGQNPAAGSAPIASGSAIDLVVQETSIPNLVGLSYDEATNNIALAGLTVGTVTETYIFDTTPSEVLEQSPASGGSANVGDPVDLTVMEALADETSVRSTGSGNWMNPGVWNNAIPVRETQGLKVQGLGSYTISLTNKVAVSFFVGGDNEPFNLNIQDGGHLVTGQFGAWASVGYNAPMTLNVSTGGVFECRAPLLFAFEPSGDGFYTASMNIDGGSVWIGEWISLGSVGTSYAETTIQNGGSLSFNHFWGKTARTNGVINLHEGSITLRGGNATEDIQWALDNGVIVVADGYAISMDDSSGDTVLTSYLPGYVGWASGQGIGGENEDDDLDLRDNLYEYALNGDPKDDQDLGVEPVMVDLGGTYEYIHLMRHDDTNLVYSLETTVSLANPAWADIGYTTVVGTNVTGEAYDVVTNSIPTTADEIFIRLKVTNP